MANKNSNYDLYLNEDSYADSTKKKTKGTKKSNNTKNVKKASNKKPSTNKKASASKKTAAPKKTAAAKKTASQKKSKPSKKTNSKNKQKLSQRIKTFWKTPGNTGKKILIIIAIILVIAIVVGGIFLWSKLSLMDTNGEDDFKATEMEDDIDLSEMEGITNANSLNDFLYKWANNGGEKMHSKYVKNVLLIGKDSRSNLADSMILVSVNEKSKKINLVSFYRDSYTYIKPGKKKGTFAKLNSAYSKGGANCLIQTIENDYKIKIDDYLMVDYNSFPKVINSLGGVNVYVTPKEAAYFANNVWESTTLNGQRINYKSGVNHMNGEAALLFCRMRHLDSDIGRTERQRRVISSIITSFKSANISRINSAINTLLPNVKTSMSRTEVLSFATNAVSSGWLNFKMDQATMPSDGMAKGGFVGSQWVWLVDYEGSAYQLQTLLYGKSNIKLPADRVSPIKLKPTKPVSGGQTVPTTKSKAPVVTTTLPVTTTIPESTTDISISDPSNVDPSIEDQSNENQENTNTSKPNGGRFPITSEEWSSILDEFNGRG